MASAENSRRYKYRCKYCNFEVLDKHTFIRHKKEKHRDEVSNSSRTCSETFSKSGSESVFSERDTNGLPCGSPSLFSVFSDSGETESTSHSEGPRTIANESTGPKIGSPNRTDKENSEEVADASLMVNFNGYEGPTPTGRPSRRRQKVPANVPFTPKRRKIIVPVPYGMPLDANNPNKTQKFSGG